MANFFDTYPQVKYDFLQNNRTQNIPDIFRQIRGSDIRLNKVVTFEWVDFREERPDQLSYRLYGTPDYHWTFFIINPQLSRGIHDWPMLHAEFQDYIDREYNYHTLRAYRNPDDDIEYNKVDDRAAIDAKMIGLTSGALATIVCRDIPMNTIKFTYDNDRVFHENQFQSDWERILIIEEEDWYYYGWEDFYSEFDPTDGVSDWDFYTREDSILDIYERSYDIREGRNMIHHWFDESRGYYYNNYENLDFALVPDANITFQTNLEWEIETNEQRSRIAIIRPDYIVDFAYQYFDKLKK